jgi:hypothetical protein
MKKSAQQFQQILRIQDYDQKAKKINQYSRLNFPDLKQRLSFIESIPNIDDDTKLYVLDYFLKDIDNINQRKQYITKIRNEQNRSILMTEFAQKKENFPNARQAQQFILRIPDEASKSSSFFYLLFDYDTELSPIQRRNILDKISIEPYKSRAMELFSKNSDNFQNAQQRRLFIDQITDPISRAKARVHFLEDHTNFENETDMENYARSTGSLNPQETEMYDARMDAIRLYANSEPTWRHQEIYGRNQIVQRPLQQRRSAENNLRLINFLSSPQQQLIPQQLKSSIQRHTIQKFLNDRGIRFSSQDNNQQLFRKIQQFKKRRMIQRKQSQRDNYSDPFTTQQEFTQPVFGNDGLVYDKINADKYLQNRKIFVNMGGSMPFKDYRPMTRQEFQQYRKNYREMTEQEFQQYKKELKKKKYSQSK